MSNSDQNHESNDIARQRAEAERQIVQIEEEILRQRRVERRGCLGCAFIVAIPVAFYSWRIISIGMGMSEAADFEHRVAAIGGRVRFWGSDDMGRGEGVNGVSTIIIRREDFSDKDMLKLAPLLVEAESFGYLSLRWTKITDKGLQYFPAGVKLGTLDIRETDITKAGIDKLLLRLPYLQDTTIYFDGGVVKNNKVRPLNDSD